jgi:hypothetical protein
MNKVRNETYLPIPYHIQYGIRNPVIVVISGGKIIHLNGLLGENKKQQIGRDLESGGCGRWNYAGTLLGKVKKITNPCSKYLLVCVVF